jgi:hypothetical protein
MTNIPDEWIDTLGRTMGASSWDARTGIKALYPLVAVYVANQIADAIAAQSRITWDNGEVHGYCSGMHDAARIARGWSP